MMGYGVFTGQAFRRYAGFTILLLCVPVARAQPGFHEAVLANCADSVALLVAAGARRDARTDSGSTAGDLAERYASAGVVRALEPADDRATGE